MKNILLFLFILLLLSMACEDVPTDSHEEEDPNSFAGILFVRHNSDMTESLICRVDSDGTNLDTLTINDTITYIMSPTVSSDGTRLVYAARNLSGFDLYRITLDNADPVRITNLDGLVINPVFSADGTRILFEAATSSYSDDANIYVVNTDGTGIEKLTNVITGYHSPVWSPTSTDSIYYIGEGGQVHMMNLEDQGIISLPLGIITPSNLAFSPVDSTFLIDADIVISVDTVHRHIFRGDSFVLRPVDISRAAMQDWNPSWSPDGSRFVFESTGMSGETDDDGLYIGLPDGSSQTKIVGTDGYDTDPVWSPIE